MYKNVYKHDEMKRAEHMAVRESAGWYCFTHQLLEISGADSARFLDLMFPGNIGNLAVSRDRYTTMLNENGQIIDDVVVMHVEEGVYWVSTLYLKRMLPWFEEHKEGYDVAFSDITRQWNMYAIQGPRSLEVLNSILDQPLDDQKFFQVLDNTAHGIPVKVNRGGFTGESLGYEVYASPESSPKLIELLRGAEKPFGMKEVTDIQVMIWTLPTEKGFSLMCDLHWANPFEVGLARGIDWNKDFIGKDALLQVKDEGAKRTLMGFIVDEEDIFIPAKNLGGPGTAVMLDGEEIGRVTKMTYSYCLDKNIGYALVESDKATPGKTVSLHGFDAVLCDKVFC